jgi:hypothetical protein
MRNRALLLGILMVGTVVVPSSIVSGADDFAKDKFPEWLARTSGEFYYDSDGRELRFSLDTIQPLLFSPDLTHTIFVQGRGSYQDELWTANAGLGYRYLTPSRDWMLGINGFYDRNWDPNHQRWGVGAEIMGRHLTFRSNYYNAVTGWKKISETTNTRVEEKALDGFDAGLETPLPYMPWARASFGYYGWNVEDADDIDGFRGSVKMDLTGWTRLETGVMADNKDTEAFVKLRFSLGEPAGVETTLADTGFTTDMPFQGRDLTKHRLDKVERHDNIAVQRRTVNKNTGGTTGGVIIGRGA